MNNPEEKQNIQNLPLPEKVVAVALKHIFDQIKLIQEEQNKQIQKVHHSFVSKFKQVEEKSHKIVQGGPIDSGLLEKAGTYVEASEIQDVNNLAKNNKGISAYWLTTLLNFYGEDLSSSDKEIAAAIVNISTNILDDRLELTFQLGKNDYLSSGTFTRRFYLDEGRPSKVDGDIPTWLKPKEEGIIQFLLSNIPVEQIGEAFNIAGQFINEIVPYSLQYFLGAVEQIQLGEDFEDDQDEQQDQDDQDQIAPTKKTKH